jgi:hypothetical protein
MKSEPITPNCPRCSQPPALLLDDGRQAFCGNTACVVLTWNPTETVAELEANMKEVEL